jgi:hypothetical protein
MPGAHLLLGNPAMLLGAAQGLRLRQQRMVTLMTLS